MSIRRALSGSSSNKNKSKTGAASRFQQLAPGVRMDTVTIDQALQVAEVAAREGGKVVLALMGEKGRPAGELAPSHRSRIENAIISVLDACELGFEVHNRAPKASAWSEPDENVEQVDEALSMAPTWLIESVSNSTNSVSEVIISVGLAVNFVPAVGVILDPAADELYKARVGGEATLNGSAMSVSKSSDKEKLITCTCIREIEDEERSNYRDHVTKTMGSLMSQGLYNIRVLQSPAKCLSLLAKGQANCYFECGPKPEEVCAGIVLVRVAKGLIGNLGTVAPTAYSLTENEEPAGALQFDLQARRYLCYSTTEVKQVIDGCIQGPIPFMITTSNDNPFVDDFQEADPQFAQLHSVDRDAITDQSRVFAPGELGDGSERILSISRWSEDSVKGPKRNQKFNNSTSESVADVIVPKENAWMYATLGRSKIKANVIPVEDTKPVVKGAKTRRQLEVEKHCLPDGEEKEPQSQNSIPQPFAPPTRVTSSDGRPSESVKVAPVSPYTMTAEPESKEDKEKRLRQIESADIAANAVLDSAFKELPADKLASVDTSLSDVDKEVELVVNTLLSSNNQKVSATARSKLVQQNTWDVDTSPSPTPEPINEDDGYLGIGESEGVPQDDGYIGIGEQKLQGTEIDDGYIGIGEVQNPAQSDLIKIDRLSVH